MPREAYAKNPPAATTDAPSAVLIHGSGRVRARPRGGVRIREREGAREGLGARQSRGRARTRPGIGLGEKPAMWVGVGRRPLGSVVDSAEAKWFRVSQVVLSGGDQCDE